ncbi:uncharacterized protein LOC125947709 [Dermacentor silvarum]|uniref:uncharacterized protein LOC125947709 n=1 Tax=Dermacentor silvarum TaxID=543639 RepID=UPI0021009128|nr:uncharacterized protein LOC125947709 [Dermacentor silvarum]
MKTLVIFCYFLLCRISLGLANLHPSEGPREMANDAPDSVKVFEVFSSLVLIADSSNNSLLDCLHAHRSELNMKAHTATYTWFLPKIGQTLPFYCKAADHGAITCTAGNGFMYPFREIE